MTKRAGADESKLSVSLTAQLTGQSEACLAERKKLTSDIDFAKSLPLNGRS